MCKPALPRIGHLPQHLFDEFQKIRFSTAADKWTGGDITVHLNSISRIVFQQMQLQPGATSWMLDIEHERMPLDSSSACQAWVKPTLELIPGPCSLYDSLLFPTQQKFGTPCVYPACHIVQHPGPSNEESYATWIRYAKTKCKKWFGVEQVVHPFIATNYFWDTPDSDGNYPPIPLDVIEMMVATLSEYNPTLYAELRTQTEADRFAKIMEAAKSW